MGYQIKNVFYNAYELGTTQEIFISVFKKPANIPVFIKDMWTLMYLHFFSPKDCWDEWKNGFLRLFYKYNRFKKGEKSPFPIGIPQT